ncbi:MAG TPA: aminotransferase class I/II-fold pyridoxal phosphate-dependent enzyme [Thermomicrobiales bacterium]|nr:aminotransferase class I/II-fold pyridoxal phosphate-dependent enzyme [Thermomicrobiales bacterium]
MAATNRDQRRAAHVTRSLRGVNRFMTHSGWAQRRDRRGVMDFALGNPQDMPMPEITQALKFWADPLTRDWFAYKTSDSCAQIVAARSLRERTGVPFESEDIAMTNGAFGALTAGIKLVTLPGDEVLFNLPPWFCYEALIEDAGAVPVKVNVQPEDFDLDIAAIAEAISPRTRLVILNTPHNPTGRIYDRRSLQELASVLEEASRRNGRRIYLLSDEVYARIVFDGNRAVSPAEVYDHTLVVYSWSKQLLIPGQRIGYLAVHPNMPEREELREEVVAIQLASGYAFPNALLQHALGDLDRLSINVDHLQRKRDRMVGALREIGYEVHSPQATFYLLPKSPIADDQLFSEMLAERDVFVVPGALVEYPGYFRISLTASDDMIERSLPHFEAVYRLSRLQESMIA